MLQKMKAHKKKVILLILFLLIAGLFAVYTNNNGLPVDESCNGRWVIEEGESDRLITVEVIAEEGLKIRTSPEIKEYNRIDSYALGEVFNFNVSDITVKDGFIWAKHDIGINNMHGYSALCNDSGSWVYVREYDINPMRYTPYGGGADNIVYPVIEVQTGQEPVSNVYVDNDCQFTHWEEINNICTTTDVDKDGDVDEADMDTMFEAGWYAHKYRVGGHCDPDIVPHRYRWFPTIKKDFTRDSGKWLKEPCPRTKKELGPIVLPTVARPVQTPTPRTCLTEETIYYNHGSGANEAEARENLEVKPDTVCIKWN